MELDQRIPRGAIGPEAPRSPLGLLCPLILLWPLLGGPLLGGPLLGGPLLGGPAAAAEPDFPRAVSAPLNASFRLVAKGKPLRETLVDLRERTELRVWLDRRIDPGRPLSRDVYGPTVRDVLAQLADEHQLEIGVADEVVVLGPAPSPERAATEMLAAWDRLADSPALAGGGRHVDLAELRTIRWPKLTTPDEALKIVADSWDLQVEEVSLPHDLWPEVDLGQVRVTTALGLIGLGFDVALELDPATRQVRARPLSESSRVERDYLVPALPPAVRTELTSPAVGGQLRKTDERWSLSGPARAHAILEVLLSAQERRTARPAREKTEPGSGQRYSLRLVNKPAGEFLAALCRTAGWQLEVEAGASELLAKPIDMQAEQVTLDELVERAVRPLGLRAEREGELLRIMVDR